jgi:hypothetical protein
VWIAPAWTMFLSAAGTAKDDVIASRIEGSTVIARAPSSKLML